MKILRLKIKIRDTTLIQFLKTEEQDTNQKMDNCTYNFDR